VNSIFVCFCLILPNSIFIFCLTSFLHLRSSSTEGHGTFSPYCVPFAWMTRILFFFARIYGACSHKRVSHSLLSFFLSPHLENSPFYVPSSSSATDEVKFRNSQMNERTRNVRSEGKKKSENRICRTRGNKNDLEWEDRNRVAKRVYE
jgi:hypothetical protein